jgi:DHA1 family bicyclomycin/chloramphenicol resistance-like MFS transporter
MFIIRKMRDRRAPEPAFPEFVGLMGFMMALISLSIDNLLPAFGAIQADFGVSDANALQYVLTAYMAGFGLMQLVYGLVSDVIGRRPTLLIGLSIYCVGSVLAITANSFEWLLVARAIQGVGGAAARVLTDAIIRDRFAGREMARTLSLTMMIFIIVQVLAPAIGQSMLLLGSWRLIFSGMLALALMQIVWFNLRMPETLHAQNRLPLSVGRIWDGVRLCLTTRVLTGYATASGLMIGTLMAYLGSSQAIFGAGIYSLGSFFPIAFGLIASVMGLASLLNSRVVRRLGMRRVSQTATCCFVAVAAIQLLVALSYGGRPPLLFFGTTLAATMFLFSLTVPNFNAMAMEPLGAVAGTASSIVGSYSNITGTLLGAWIGQAFNGTVLPLCFGSFGLGLLSFIVVLWSERGRLFPPNHPEFLYSEAALVQSGDGIR